MIFGQHAVKIVSDVLLRPDVLSPKFTYKFDGPQAGFPTVAAVYDRRFFLQHAIKPAVIDRRYSEKWFPKM